MRDLGRTRIGIIELVCAGLLTVYGTWANPGAVKREAGISLELTLKKNIYDAVVIAAAHELFRNIGIRKIRQLAEKTRMLLDVADLFAAGQTDSRL
jgi:UDP-N-acetyl-D-glucosamine/UDP-N-acetyl-D-galactosamine dehydrogenase